MLQQPALALKSAAIFYQRSVGADQAMAGDHDADRICAIGVTDRAHRSGHLELRRQRAITHRAARRYRRQCRPDPALERRSCNAPSDGAEAVEVTLEIS